jgi:tetratricopeptide (TPR) repeat protein
MSLNNLGTVYGEMKEYDEAEKCYTEALAIYKELARNNPQAYNHYVAGTLNYLGILYAYKAEPDYAKAADCYIECLKIRKALAEEHPQAWNPYVASTLSNMALFYQKAYPDKTLSIKHAEDAISILDKCNDDSAMVRDARGRANRVLEDWKAK